MVAARANWKGYIKFGEVACAVALYTAASSSERIAFNTLNRATGNRVRREFVDSETGDSVEREDQVKGDETENGDYIVLEPDEIAETRLPLLDHRLVGFALSLPLSILRANGQTKWPLRQLLHKYVPRGLVDRPKMGFGVPIDAWLRGALRNWAEALLDARRLREDGLFRPEPIRQAWSEHLSGHPNNQYLLWDVLMFQSWREAQQDASTTAAA